MMKQDDISFRITLNHLKQDLVGLEKFEDNKLYQDFISERFKQHLLQQHERHNQGHNDEKLEHQDHNEQKQEKQEEISQKSAIEDTNEINNNNNNDDILRNKSIDIFDLILANVNVDEIDEDYVYIREIDNDLYLKDINTTSPILDNNNTNNNIDKNNDNNIENNSSNQDDLDQNKNNESNDRDSNDDNDRNNGEDKLKSEKKKVTKKTKNENKKQNDDKESMENLILSDDDDDNDINNDSSENEEEEKEDEDEDENKEEKENNKMKREIRENKKNMIKKIKELKAHDDTFNEAFKFIDINKWLQTKGSDIISNEGSLEYDIRDCMNTLEDKINELNNLIEISSLGNNGKTINNKSKLSFSSNTANQEDDEDIR
ncbi:hypothetical protein RB653_010610 [Dictyostelium firmibasis]|uniref:Uncharacterized protein n=1 Tax=Dictyostelium firmibasis TaxID=79012 RepID=A0AAN7TSX9_9MYCE